MSWDIFVMDLPSGLGSIADIPEDFAPRVLGTRDEIIGTIRRVVPFADFGDPTWGRIDGPDFSIEVNLGQEDPVRSFAFHVGGGDFAAGIVADVLQALDLRAVEPGSETGLFDPKTAAESLRQWRAYRAHVVGSSTN